MFNIAVTTRPAIAKLGFPSFRINVLKIFSKTYIIPNVNNTCK